MKCRRDALNLVKDEKDYCNEYSYSILKRWITSVRLGMFIWAINSWAKHFWGWDCYGIIEKDKLPGLYQMQADVILTRGKIQEMLALDTPWRHMGEVHVRHSFLSSAMQGSSQLQAPAILPPVFTK